MTVDGVGQDVGVDILGQRVDVDLDAETEQRLTELVESARSRQAKALAKAVDDGLNHLPKLLRGPVRKVLF